MIIDIIKIIILLVIDITLFNFLSIKNNIFKIFLLYIFILNKKKNKDYYFLFSLFFLYIYDLIFSLNFFYTTLNYTIIYIINIAIKDNIYLNRYSNVLINISLIYLSIIIDSYLLDVMINILKFIT